MYFYRQIYGRSWRNLLFNVKVFPSRVRNLWQRLWHGYGSDDLWEFDDYLAKMLVKALRDLNERKMGHPADLTEDQWDEKLEMMIAGFQAYLRLSGDDMTTLNIPERETRHLAYKKDCQTFKDGMKEFAEFYTSLWI